MFRVWHQLPQHFYLQIFSNTAFSTGSKFYIQHALTSDTMSYTHYGSKLILLVFHNWVGFITNCTIQSLLVQRVQQISLSLTILVVWKSASVTICYKHLFAISYSLSLKESNFKLPVGSFLIIAILTTL